jgi:cystathionine gamma-lyase
VPVEERKLLGIEDNMIRLSVGIEEVEDILDDLERGFEVVN